jgi:signal peptidase I
MADERTTLPASEPAPAPLARSTDVTVAPGPTPAGPFGEARDGGRAGADGDQAARSELVQLAGWMAGLVVVFVCGWGLIGLAYYLTRSFTDNFLVPVVPAALVSLGLFLLLEKDLWLSRLMGLRIHPGAHGWMSALLLWALGLPGLFFRTTGPAPGTATASGTQRDKTRTEPQTADSTREIVETIVFVVVLVLLLKSFVAEAFVIPTGSMAESLWGYQKVVTCPQCGLQFPVNCSQEVDPQDGNPDHVIRCSCPSCRLDIQLIPSRVEGSWLTFDRTVRWLAPDERGNLVVLRGEPNKVNEVADPGPNSGDRVLVVKPAYDLFGNSPERLDVVVFKYPGGSPGEPFPSSGPYKHHVPMNYIKRLIGLSGETIAICGGKLYFLRPDKGPKYDPPTSRAEEEGGPPQHWRMPYLHADDPVARDLFKRGHFEIVRKSPDNILSMMRLVYDNEHQAKDLQGVLPPRWAPAVSDTWSSDGFGFRYTPPSTPLAEGKHHWLRYRHILPLDATRQSGKQQLITDFMGYNTWRGLHSAPPHGPPYPPLPENWVGDLILECEVTIDKAEGELVLELSKSVDRFRAVFNLADGECALYRVTDGGATKLRAKKTSLGKGTYRLRFANVDDRLTVWVDKGLPFESGEPYEPARAAEQNLTDEKADLHMTGPRESNDLEPASIGVRGASVAVKKLKLFRDTYYTVSPSNADVNVKDFSNPNTWDVLTRMPFKTLYVQPGHYLCLGDNSPESSDGRSWGLVPERLMLGKALLVYYPFGRAGRIR